ncbi:serine hydrolase domain-containing protein [Actinoplanes sp. NPDC024001]|uniref:serine hydrolase domain-containing protein n=1 Tax=Actinoplanes sp. NPDC024001 TaxID=3154598 RepID=UPI00340882A8
MTVDLVIKSLAKRTTVIALTATLVAGASAPATAHPPQRPDYQAAIQAFVDAGFAGMHMRVHDERGEWAGSAGVRRLGTAAKPPVNGHFRIGSTTKTFTATMVLQLVNEGRIGLDDPVADHLTRFGLDRRITVRMLLQHTSGLFNYTGEFYPDGTFVPGVPAGGKDWVDHRLRTYQPDELVRLALAKPARYAPGTTFHYTNTNYTLAGLLVEQVSGHSYAEELRRRILRPLELRGTVAPGAWSGLPAPYAHGYYRYQDASEWRTIDVTRQNPSLLFAAGDMISTTEDLHRFFSALMSGKLLPASLLAEMRTPNPVLGYGLGVFVQNLSPACDVTVIHHNGSPPGGYGALMYSTPDGRKTLTASVTTGDAAIDPGTAFNRSLPGLLRTVFCGGSGPRGISR